LERRVNVAAEVVHSAKSGVYTKSYTSDQSTHVSHSMLPSFPIRHCLQQRPDGLLLGLAHHRSGVCWLGLAVNGSVGEIYAVSTSLPENSDPSCEIADSVFRRFIVCAHNSIQHRRPDATVLE
jgi:hypothetical protein